MENAEWNTFGRDNQTLAKHNNSMSKYQVKLLVEPNCSKGIVSCRDLFHITLEKIKTELIEQSVTNVTNAGYQW